MSGKVSIIGAAGTLGSAAAYAIATQGLASELVMVDIRENLLKCHVLDLETAVAGLHRMKVTAGRPPDVAGSDLVILSPAAPWRQISDRMELLRDNLPIIRSVGEYIARYCPEAVVITATNPVDPLNHVLHLVTGMDRRRLLGYTINDSLRFRMLAARMLGADAARAAGITVGEHGSHQVMLFSNLRLDGRPVELSSEQRQRVRAGVPAALHAFESLKSGRTTGWTSAVGLSALARSVLQDLGEVHPCSINLDGEGGYQGFSASLPVKLGRQGAAEIVLPPLTPEDETGFQEAMEYLQGAAAQAAALLD